jgi:hypothetical protein
VPTAWYNSSIKGAVMDTVRRKAVMDIDPHTLIGKQIPAADGGNYGHLVVGYNPTAGDLLVVPIRWSTGEPLNPADTGPLTLDLFKASYRYQFDKAR